MKFIAHIILSDFIAKAVRHYYGSVFLPGMLMLLLFFLQSPALAQQDTTKVSTADAMADSLARVSAGLAASDTLSGLSASDTLSGQYASDTLSNQDDSLLKEPKPMGLESSVVYKSFEKIHYDVRNQKVFLYKDAEIEYGDIKLRADYIEIDFGKNLVYAKGVPDSTGKVQGSPVFSEGGKEFESEEMNYNFDTKKGLIRHVITQEGEGYLHGEVIKKMPDDRINILHGSYTTCDLKHPHFEFRYTKAQVTPNDKIVSGPAYFVVEGVPMPLALPFGIFPNQTGQRSGIIIPSFGESANRGFFIEKAGYYWGINDYMDFTVTGDIFTSGSWAIRPTFRYANRYHYQGNFDFSYAVNIIGDKDDPGTEPSKDFSVRWTHSQDPKAKPNSRFSANVNIVSSSFNDYNLTSTQNYLSNTFQSSVSYQTNFNNALFLSVNATHQQNTIDRSVNMSLPTLTLNTKQVYPFRRKEQVGKVRWYENINMKYSMSADNRISTKDTLLFKPGWTDDFKYGAKQTIPISSSVKILKFFNLTNSINYSSKWYPYSIHKTWNADTLYTETDTIYGAVETDTVNKIIAAREFSYRASVSTRLYGMYQFTKGPVTAIRHVVTPSVSFSLRPDFGSDFWGYYDVVQKNTEGDMERYSIFEGSLYGGPPDGRSGQLGFSLGNNLEMKVRSKKDTITGTKKVVLIDNFTISSSYDLAKDSLNWAPLTLSGRTTLFKKLNITYASSWIPYAVNENGVVINEYEWDVNNKPFRLSNTIWSFGMNYRFSADDFKKGKDKGSPGPTPEEEPIDQNYELFEKYSEEEINDVFNNPDQYINWNNAWSLSINYSLRYSNNPTYLDYERQDLRTTVQTLGLSGDISITPKWKINFRTGWDFETKKFTYTTIDFYRDLHCWEMRFSWIPTGTRQSWTFGINIKASILKDLKYDRKKDFRDSY